MRKRILSFLLAASAAFCFICSSAPEAQAIIPIGLVQSALASYVTSAGYKMWSDNGGGDVMVEALSTLYQSWLDSTDPVGALTLGQMSENDYTYLDSSGQIVIRKAAADMFQQFSDWIQTEHSVPIGSDTPTEVVAPSGGYLTNGNGFVAYKSVLGSSADGMSTSGNALRLSDPIGTYNGDPVYLASEYGNREVYFAWSGSSVYFAATRNYPVGFARPAANNRYTYISVINSPSSSFKSSSGWSGYSFSIPESVSPSGTVTISSLTGSVSGVAGLGVTLAHAVADVVGQAKDDDAVVIGVGASAGATAQDIADLVAQGIKAQTLNPSVSITAEAVIDTPVQPYPDIESLGLPSLGAALVERFPFCIPWDFVDTVKLLSADPQPINIKVDLIPQRIKTSVGITSDTSFDIDLSGEQYAKIGVFCRWGTLITFCFGLFLLTKRLVWTA